MAEIPICVSVVFSRHYLADYLKSYYGGHPIKLTVTTRVYPYFSRFITPAPLRFRGVKPGPGVITFELPYNRTQDIRRLNYINPKHYPVIQTYFYNLFYANFVLFMDDACLIKGLPFKSAIINFMEINEMSFDRCQYDSLKRIYLRHRKQAIKRKYFVTNQTKYEHKSHIIDP